MQSHLNRLKSPHNLFLSSLTRDYIAKKRTLPDEEPQVHIHHNEVHISNIDNDSDNWREIEDRDLRIVINELTKKARLYKVKSFDKLSLSFSRCVGITNQSAKHMRQSIMKNFPGLKSLAINFYEAVEISEAGIEQIARLASSYKDLESLQIKFAIFPRISDKALNESIKRIHKSLKHLRNLHIDVSVRYESINGNFMLTEPDLFQRLAHVGHNGSHGVYTSFLSTEGILEASFAITKYFGSSLQELNLNFAFLQTITDKICQELGQRILEKMAALKRLTLSFYGCRSLTNEALSLFSNKACKRNVLALEHLTLEFAHMSISDPGLKYLQEGITSQFKALKKLALNLMMCSNISDHAAKEFNNEIVNNLKSLQSFTLALYGNKSIDGESLKTISQDITQNLKGLKELGLIFSNVNTEFLPAISSDLIQSPATLEKLALTLCRTQMNPPLNIEKFQHALGTALKNLRELNLDFIANSIENEFLKELGKSIQELSNLKKLALSFAQTDIGTKPLGQDFILGGLVPQFVALQSFEVFFNSCQSLPDELFNGLGKSLCQFQPGLERLHVDFSCCNSITGESYKEFCNGIQKNMKKLSHLTLNFTFCLGISDKTKEEVKLSLKEIPIVTLYY